MAFVMLLTLCVPAYAAEGKDEHEFVPPTLAEGEVWVPADGTMPLLDGCAKGCSPGSGYVYQGYVKGNTTFEATLRGVTWDLLGFIPIVGRVFFAIRAVEIGASVVDYMTKNGEVPTVYYQYVYYNSAECAYWYHFVFRDNVNGSGRYLDCYYMWADEAAGRSM